MIAPTEITNTSLLKEEHMWHTEMAGIVTITFVRGKNVSDNLKKRLVDVAQANPWICGHLTKGSPYHNLNIPIAEHAAQSQSANGCQPCHQHGCIHLMHSI